MWKSADKSLLQPWRSHSNTIYDVQLQKTIVLRCITHAAASTKQPWFNHYNAFSNITCLTRMSLSTWQQIMTTFIQPPQCDLQRGIPKPHRTTHVTRRHAKCRTPRGEPQNIKTNVPATASHTSCPSPPPAATLHGKTQGFVLRLPPHTKPHAPFMQPFQCDLQPGIPQPHRATQTRRHAKCRTPRENPKTSKRAYPQPPYTRAAIHRRLQPLYTEKHKVFLPNTSPMQHSCSHYNAFVLECAVLSLTPPFMMYYVM